MSDTTVGRPYPELTWVALIVGWFIGVILAGAIGYAALVLGFSIEGSELAAILGFGILRGLFGRKSIVENNIVQTIATRESMVHLFGLQTYADIMSNFAAGERYINRVWSASADGYDEEANTYLKKAAGQFDAARQALLKAADSIA